MSVLDVLEARRALLLERADAIRAMGLADACEYELALLLDELQALREVYVALLADVRARGART